MIVSHSFIKETVRALWYRSTTSTCAHLTSTGVSTGEKEALIRTVPDLISILPSYVDAADEARSMVFSLFFSTRLIASLLLYSNMGFKGWDPPAMCITIRRIRLARLTWYVQIDLQDFSVTSFVSKEGCWAFPSGFSTCLALFNWYLLSIFSASLLFKSTQRQTENYPTI